MTEPPVPGRGAGERRASRPLRVVRFFDPAQPGCVGRLARLAVAALVVGGCAVCAGSVAFLRSERGRSLTLYVLYDNWWNEACAQFADDLIADYPASNWHYYRMKGACLRRLGRIDESLRAYDDAIAAMPDNWWPYSHRCFYRGLLDDPSAVLADCDRSVALGPSDMVVAHDRRAMIRALLGDPRGAIEDLETALELSASGAPGAYSDKVRATRETWVAALREGRNPLTPEAIWSELASFGTPRQ